MVRPPSQSGFTLLEVLVAFVVLAMMLGVILSLNSVSLDSTSRAVLRQQALILAQSELAKVLGDAELEPGRRSGRFDDERFEWELEIRRFTFPAEEESLDSLVGPVPYEIELSVVWEPRNRLTLNTLRLVRDQ
ncbi:MAG: prepilin-type N-terminal cleavage/methylation domain-containing protein [Oceanospirillales bacterium]|nr:prepilin-type N-terminal cleavage/methylation domain-containing protein [Oceanospirillales bacterium]